MLLERSKSVRFSRFEREVGTCPTNLLLAIIKVSNCTRFLIDAGIKPEKLHDPNDTSHSDSSSPIESGNSPMSLLFPSDRVLEDFVAENFHLDQLEKIQIPQEEVLSNFQSSEIKVKFENLRNYFLRDRALEDE